MVTQANLEKETRTMAFTHWLSNHLGLSLRPASRRNTAAARTTFRPRLEALEDRALPSTLTVSNNLDNSARSPLIAGSLRAEIAVAQDGDSIVFDSSLNGRTITLTSGELLITHSLAINGPGAGYLTVSGNHASRVFEVAQATTVTLSGLTISNGSVTGNSGGGRGILNNGTLTVSNSTLSGNSAYKTGAGIYNNGTLTLSSSTLSKNSAPYGGGIWNTATGTLTVNSSTLSKNSAAHGGGILNNGTLTVSNSTLSDNFGFGSKSVGGGIANYQGTLTVSGSTLSGNSATHGGGIYNTATLTVNNSSSITGNTADDVYNGGVLYCEASTSAIGVLDGPGQVFKS
jgi:hypothetical protein